MYGRTAVPGGPSCSCRSSGRRPSSSTGAPWHFRAPREDPRCWSARIVGPTLGSRARPTTSGGCAVMLLMPWDRPMPQNSWSLQARRSPVVRASLRAHLGPRASSKRRWQGGTCSRSGSCETGAKTLTRSRLGGGVTRLRRPCVVSRLRRRRSRRRPVWNALPLSASARRFCRLASKPRRVGNSRSRRQLSSACRNALRVRSAA
mmetsp:Transcript_29992/g.82291  ORF Transcript_29992/g.82291 Transcript_29992/m.82291 type:complete len:204 (+) Transcript_29992:127-738(+)